MTWKEVGYVKVKRMNIPVLVCPRSRSSAGLQVFYCTIGADVSFMTGIKAISLIVTWPFSCVIRLAKGMQIMDGVDLETAKGRLEEKKPVLQGHNPEGLKVLEEWIDTDLSDLFE